MSDKYDDEIIEEEIRDQDDDDKHEPEKFCTLCRRSEKQAGKMIDLPNNIHICSDCMQKSFDSMNQQMSSSNSREARKHPADTAALQQLSRGCIAAIAGASVKEAAISTEAKTIKNQSSVC